MERDYEKIGREFIDITDRYQEEMQSAEGPREVYAILDNFVEDLRRLWQENK